MIQVLNNENEILLKKAGNVVLLIAMSVAAIISIFIPVALAAGDNLTITAYPQSVYVGEPKDVKFTVTVTVTTCIPEANNTVCTLEVTNVQGAIVTLSTTVPSSGTTGSDGTTVIRVLAAIPGDITATASYNGSSASTVIKAYARTRLKITANPDTVYVGTPRNVNFTVTEYCPPGAVACTLGSPVNDSTVQLSGAGVSGSYLTDLQGYVSVTITATSAGNITATASKDGYARGDTTIKAMGPPVLNLTADTQTVTVGKSKLVTFTVNRKCGTKPDDDCSSNPPLMPVGGVNVTLSGVASGSGITELSTSGTAQVEIPVNATDVENVVVTAKKEGYIDSVMNIPADYLPAVVITTWERNYSIGDNVVFNLMNTGPVAISPDVLQIRNSSNPPWHELYSANIVADDLAPVRSVNLSWNQKDNTDNQVPSGTYMARIVYSYHNKSFVNYTDWFNIVKVDCINKIYAPESVSSMVTQDVKFSSGNHLTNTSKTWDVTWDINGTQVYKETGVTHMSNYTNDSAAAGVWNVTAVARSGCSIITWSFVWTVNPAPPNTCFNTTNPAKLFESYLGQSVKFPSGDLAGTNKTWNFTWYLNGIEVFNDTNAVQSNYINRNASLGVWNVTVIAKSDCNRVSWAWIWTVSKEPPKPPCNNCAGDSGGSSSSGGGGITTAEPFNNILKSERRDADLLKGKPVTYSFSSPEFSIYQVLVTGKENEGDVGMRIERLKNTSALVNRVPPGIIYSNENIWASSKRIESVVIRFKISNIWLSDNGINIKDIALLRFNNGWKKLDSMIINNSDSTCTYFESRSPGLSSFAVSGLKEEAGLELPYDEVTGDNVAEEVNETETGKLSPGFEALAVIGIIPVAYLLRHQKRRK